MYLVFFFILRGLLKIRLEERLDVLIKLEIKEILFVRLNILEIISLILRKWRDKRLIIIKIKNDEISDIKNFENGRFNCEIKWNDIENIKVKSESNKIFSNIGKFNCERARVCSSTPGINNCKSNPPPPASHPLQTKFQILAKAKIFNISTLLTKFCTLSMKKWKLICCTSKQSITR